MEDEVIYNAKIYAKKKEESLSSLVENYLKSIAVNGKVEKNKTKKLHPSIAKLKGPTKLINRMNRDKNYFDKINEIFKCKEMKMDGSWSLCVKPFIKNYSRKGIKKIKDRIQRFEIWKQERMKSYQAQYVFDYY